MKNILVVGATGQIGSELTMELRKRYGGEHVIAGYITGAEPKGTLLESGPAELADVTNGRQIADIVKNYHIDTIFNLAALLSVVAEHKPLLAWHIGIDGLLNILEVARENHCAVFTPSSIGSFGPETPRVMTPQDTIQRPRTIYGVSKVTTELLSEYYFHKYGVDTRSVRFPGIISYVTPPGGGTTDYAVDIYYYAVRGEKFVCPIPEGTLMDMMYMPDALHAAIQLMEADPARLIHHNGFNVASMSFAPAEGSIEETILLTLQEHGSLITRELRAACGFDGPKMRSRFDGYVTRLQMGCYVVTEDFVYPTDKHGREYGWGWSLLTTPEALLGREACLSTHTPEESYARLTAHLKKILPGATDKQIRKLVG